MTCGTHFQPPHARDRGHRNVNINIWLLLLNRDTYHVCFYLTGHLNSISKPNFQGTRKCNSLVFSESLYPGKSQFIAGFLSLSHHTSLLIRPLHLSTGDANLPTHPSPQKHLITSGSSFACNIARSVILASSG